MFGNIEHGLSEMDQFPRPVVVVKDQEGSNITLLSIEWKVQGQDGKEPEKRFGKGRG